MEPENECLEEKIPFNNHHESFRFRVNLSWSRFPEGSYQDRMLAMCRGYLRDLLLMSLWLGFEQPRSQVLEVSETSLTIERNQADWWLAGVFLSVACKHVIDQTCCIEAKSNPNSSLSINVKLSRWQSKTISKARPRDPKTLGKTNESNKSTVPQNIVVGLIGSLSRR